MTDHANYLWGKRYKLIYCIELSALYHRKRERFYDFWDKTGKAMSVLLGTAIIGRILADQVQWLALAVTITGTLGLVFGLSEKVRRHADFSNRFCILLAEVESVGERDYTEAQLNQWCAKLASIEAQEPPALASLVQYCQNQLAANHNGEINPLKVTQKLLMHIV